MPSSSKHDVQLAERKKKRSTAEDETICVSIVEGIDYEQLVENTTGLEPFLTAK